MKTSDFDYTLPTEAIAQTPAEPRDSSRLLVLNRTNGQIEHRSFFEIKEYLRPGDLLVLNQTRVIPARMFAHKLTGGKIEILLLRREDERTWECLVGGKGLTSGKRVNLQDGLGAEIVEVLEGSRRRVRFDEAVENHLAEDGQELVVGPIRMDLDKHQVTVNSNPVSFPLKEFELLEYLMRNSGRVLTRSQLIDRVWGDDYYGDTKTLDVHIKRLGAKIENDPANPTLIHTIRGLGYKLEV
jgi:hypothetical protein